MTTDSAVNPAAYPPGYPPGLAYDRIAPDYDQQLLGDQWMRAVLWRHYLRLFRPGDQVLDVGCGTGVDAVRLAQAGVLVTAIDVSPAMAALARARAEAAGLDDRILVKVLDVAEIGRLPALGAGPFDGIISAFAGLSTLPDLTGFARDTAALLRPNGHLVLHLLNRFSLWECLGLLRHGCWAEARRLRFRHERVFVIGGLPVRHYLYYPLEAERRYFDARFELRQVYGLGALRPPYTLRRVPATAAAGLGWLDDRLARRAPLRDCGRFFVLDLTARSPERGPHDLEAR